MMDDNKAYLIRTKGCHTGLLDTFLVWECFFTRVKYHDGSKASNGTIYFNLGGINVSDLWSTILDDSTKQIHYESRWFDAVAFENHCMMLKEFETLANKKKYEKRI